MRADGCHIFNGSVRAFYVGYRLFLYLIPITAGVRV